MTKRTKRDSVVYEKVQLYERFLRSDRIHRASSSGEGIPPEIARNARATHHLDIHDPIYLLIDNAAFFKNGKTSLVLTEKGVSITDIFNQLNFECSWVELDRVSVMEEDFVFYFDPDDPTDDYVKIDSNSVLLFDFAVKEQIAKLLTEIASHFPNTELYLEKQSSKQLEAENYEEALLQANKCLELNPSNVWAQCNQAISLLETGRFDEALNSARHANTSLRSLLTREPRVEIDDDAKNTITHWLSVTKYLEAEASDALGDQINGLRYAKEAADLSTDAELRKEAIDLYTQLASRVSSTLLEMEYPNRKLIYVDDALPSPCPKHFLPVLRKELPKIVFPPGHPVSGELYVGHPHIKEVYFPFSEYEYLLFCDKSAEMNFLLQCLGARKISLECIKSGTYENKANAKSEEEHQGEVRIVGAKASGSTSRADDNRQMSEKSIRTVQAFSPTDAPHVPSNLKWFPHDVVLQRLVQQRMSGHILNSSTRISSREFEIVSQSEKEEIVAELETIWAKLGATSKKSASCQSQKETKTEWLIEVEFVPLRELSKGTEPATAQLSDSVPEGQLIDLMEDCYSDGIISEDERRIIDRLVGRFGISSERARELEEMVKRRTAFSSEEREYMDTLRDAFENDGRISEGERRILSRYRERLRVSEERAHLIEDHLKDQTRQKEGLK